MQPVQVVAAYKAEKKAEKKKKKKKKKKKEKKARKEGRQIKDKKERKDKKEKEAEFEEWVPGLRYVLLICLWRHANVVAKPSWASMIIIGSSGVMYSYVWNGKWTLSRNLAYQICQRYFDKLEDEKSLRVSDDDEEEEEDEEDHWVANDEDRCYNML